jgi:phosphate transport system substrate-binding protein
MLPTNGRKYWKYWILASLAVVVLLPVWLDGAALLMFAASAGYRGALVRAGLAAGGGALLLALAGGLYAFGKKARLPEGFLPRYAPFLAPIALTLVYWLIVSAIAGDDYFSGTASDSLLFFFLPFFVALFPATAGGAEWILPLIAIVSYLFFIACFTLGAWRGGRIRTTENAGARRALLILLALAAGAAAQTYSQYSRLLHDDPQHPELREREMLYGYMPFGKNGAKLVSPRRPPSLRIGGDYPKLDGAVALAPLYAAAAKAIYRADDETLRNSVVFSLSTPGAYNALIDGRADMIFALAPSDEQKRQAADKGLTLTATPIAREAFVFLVNAQNPVTGLSLEQIRGIYGGKISDWREVGGAPGEIMAFQRNEGSGSQIAMRRYVMHGAPMRRPIKAEYHDDMFGVTRGVAGYRNYNGALGYSFRFYATVMNAPAGIRLLAIDGIAPTPENIRAGRYPLTAEACIVTARPLTQPAEALRTWFQSDEGQQLIADVGYAPMR